MEMRQHAAVAALFLSLAMACAHRQGDTEPARGPQPMAEPVDSLRLEVENHNWSDIVVSIVHDGVTSRFTEVTAGAAKSVTIPGHLIGQLGNLRLAVRGIGATDRFTSETLSVRTGSTVRLTVESKVARSSVAVW